MDGNLVTRKEVPNMIGAMSEVFTQHLPPCFHSHTKLTRNLSNGTARYGKEPDCISSCPGGLRRRSWRSLLHSGACLSLESKHLRLNICRNHKNLLSRHRQHEVRCVTVEITCRFTSTGMLYSDTTLVTKG